MQCHFQLAKVGIHEVELTNFHPLGELCGKSQTEENAQFSGRFFVEQIIVCSHVSMHGKTAGNVPVGSKPPCILTGKTPLLSRAAGNKIH